MQLSESSPHFSGLPVRHLIRSLSYEAKTVDEQIAMGLVFETKDQTLQARKQSHLTNSTERDHQIRYPLKDRVKRSLAKLAAGVEQQIGNKKIQVQLLADDFVSIEFFKNLPQARVLLVQQTNQVSADLLTAEEQKIEQWLQNPKKYFSEILKKCRERMYASDYRTAYQILSQLPKEIKTDDVYHLLGLCTNFFGRIDESEQHFRHGLESESPHSQVRAAYVMSMLFLRMHQPQKQNLDLAEHLLQQAYETLEENKQISDWNFHRVFNRNGYALCLFRRGKIEMALNLLVNGIEALDVTSQEQNRLHQSVLIYNAVQCLRALERYSDCEKMCQTLLDIDPSFPEYHLEQARTFLDQNKVELALESIGNSIELDCFIPEAFALKGYAYLLKEDFRSAANSYRLACRLNREDVRLKLDLGYCLTEIGSEARTELIGLLKKIKPKSLSQYDLEGYQALRSGCEE